jgi:ATP phosphoribosyltransferase regulatory subunit
MNGRYPAIAPAILELMTARGATEADIAILQPADPFLDMAGEELRSRIFMTQSETGESLCLRPEFTIPVCRMHIASASAAPRRYCYLGEVFRQRRRGGNEFFQTGIEDIGDPNRAAADARSVADALEILALALPGRRFDVVCGDQSVFEAVLAALGLPLGWQKRLARAFGSRKLIDQALSDLARPAATSIGDPVVARLISAGDENRLAGHVETMMAEAGLPLKAGRTPAEIAHRLIEKTRLAETRLSTAQMAALRAFLGIRVPLVDASGALASFSSRHGIAIGGALADFSVRALALLAGKPAGDMVYDAAFGRPLDYYSGLVFEIGTPGADLPLAGGGRYDRLLTLLGAEGPVPGVGFSVWLDRVEAAAGRIP